MSTVETETKSSRKEFLTKAAGAFGVAVAAAVAEKPLAAQEKIQQGRSALRLADFPPEVRGDMLRMYDDLERALKKPIEKRRWGMAIDLRKCVGCNACTTSCISENALPPGVVYRPVLKEEIGTYPNVSTRNLPKPCMQCEDPPCVPVCPVGATFSRPDGLVEIDYERCIGCRYCITACPYEHRMFDFGLGYSDGTPERAPYDDKVNFDWQKENKRKPHRSPIGNARKCTFCVHRLEVGSLPACVTTCIGGANYFGDLNDPDALISEKIHKGNVMRLKEEAGTKPKVFYLL